MIMKEYFNMKGIVSILLTIIMMPSLLTSCGSENAEWETAPKVEYIKPIE